MIKFKNLIGITALSCAFWACSENELTNDLPSDENSGGVAEWLKVNMGVNVEEGVMGDENAQEARTPASVDETDRPNKNYMLNYLGMVSVSPKVQPTIEDANSQKVKDIEYELNSHYREIKFNEDNEFEVYFQLEEDELQFDGASVNGVLRIAGSQNANVASQEEPLEVKLTLVDKNKLNNHIPLYDLFYSNESTAPLGDSFYYLSYNPEVTLSEGTGFIPELPELTKEQVNMSDQIWQTITGGQPIYDEYGDRLFQSDQVIAMADEEYIYFYEVVLVNGENGGYTLLSKFHRNGSSNFTRLSLKRLTTIVNASFILIDKQVWDEDSYLTMADGRVDREQSEQKYFERFGVNLKGMTCPYATMDGVNLKYDITNMSSDDNTSELVRLLLWADGYDTIAPDGKKHGKKGEYSYEKAFQLDEGLARGIGIAGKSYSVIFKGNAEDNRYQNVCFYVNVDGVNIKIKAYSANGFAFNQNKTHNVIVMVNAQKFADTVKEYKASANLLSRSVAKEYVELEVPAENVIIK